MWMFLFAKLIKWEESDNGSFKNNQKKKGKGCTEAAVPERKEQKGGQVNHAEVFRGYR